jgi:hypothetical protein
VAGSYVYISQPSRSKKAGNLPAERLLTSQGKLCSMRSVNQFQLTTFYYQYVENRSRLFNEDETATYFI